MKKVAFLSLLMPAIIIVLFFYIGKVENAESGVDLALFDTKIMLNYWSVVIAYLLMAFFIFSLFSAIATRFKVSAFNGLLLISVTGIIIVTIQLLIIFL